MAAREQIEVSWKLVVWLEVGYGHQFGPGPPPEWVRQVSWHRSLWAAMRAIGRQPETCGVYLRVQFQLEQYIRFPGERWKPYCYI